MPSPKGAATTQEAESNSKEPSQTNQPIEERTKSDEELKPHDLLMPEDLDDDLDVVSATELEVQKPSKESLSWNPIVSIEDFFSNDMPLGPHSPEQSPCYPIIGSKPGEIPTDTAYYCKLHPDMIPSTFLQAIENHCRDEEPDIHKAEILRIIGESA